MALDFELWLIFHGGVRVNNRYVYTIAGAEVAQDKINDIGEQIVQLIMSELPEEAQTYDVALYILRNAKMRIRGSRLKL